MNVLFFDSMFLDSKYLLITQGIIFQVFLIKFIIAFCFLVFASIKDFKSREVWDWLSYSLFAIAVIYNVFLSIFYSTWFFVISSFFGFLVISLFSLFLFYSGQWGGGDTKILIGLSTLFGLPFSLNWFYHMSSIVGFLFFSLIASSLYGILWSIFIAVRYSKKNKGKIQKEYNKIMKNNKKLRNLVLCFVFIFVISAFIDLLINDFCVSCSNLFWILLIFGFLVLVMMFFSVFIKALEKTAMVKEIKVKDLVEGDWVLNTILVKNDSMSYLEYIVFRYFDNFQSTSYLSRLFFWFKLRRKNVKTRNEKRFSEYEFNNAYYNYLKEKVIKRILHEFKIHDDEKEYYIELINMKPNEINAEKIAKKVLEIMMDNGYLIKDEKIIVYDKKDLGISLSQISFLIKKFGSNKEFSVKDGIPFVPGFLFGLIVQFFVMLFIFI